MKQDRNGARTAQDLERKYNLSDIENNIELHEKSISKVNNELTKFTNNVTQQFEKVQTVIDQKAEIWFYSGAPSLSNPPTNSWGDFSMHVGDLYYDTQTGYAYRFKVVNSTYSWERIQDQDVIQSLALANSASDTADSKRRIFVLPPTPPYDNGDLWIKNRELYVCQISKAEVEEFAENDFIIATKYTDDTVANQVGNSLTVVQGQVTTVIQSNNKLQIDFKTTTELVDKTNVDLTNKIEALNNSTTIKLNDITKYIRAIDGDIILGNSDNQLTLKITNEKIIFMNGNVEMCYLKNNKLYVPEEIQIPLGGTLKLGNYSFVPRSNGNLSFKFIG